MQVFFLFFCTFFRTIQEPRIFRVCTHFFVSSLFYFFYIYNSNLFSVNVLKKTLYTQYSICFIEQRKSTTSAHVVLFLFGMSLRGFPRCIAVCYYIQSWGMLLRRGSIYINWSLPSQDRSWGKQSATA